MKKRTRIRKRKSLLALVLFLSATLAFAQAGKPAATGSAKPFVLGVIDELTSKELGEKRVLNVYLPEGYNAADTTRYPVIYLLDGSADEDFIHVVGLVQFNSFEWVQRVPRSIVVGIASVDRRRDFTFPTTVAADKKAYPTTGHSGKFMAFIEKELQPFIEAKYKTGKDKTLIGQSLGGLLATEILFTHPTLFNRYVIVSPSLWWDNGSLLSEAATALKSVNQPTGIYVGVGKEGLTSTAVPRVMEVDANLLADKIKALKNPALHVFFDYLPAEDHATVMHAAVSNALTLLFAGKANAEKQ